MIRFVERGEDQFGTREIVGAGFRESHGPGAAGQQRRPHMLLKRRDDPGRGGLRHAHLPRRGREAAATGDSNEKLH